MASMIDRVILAVKLDKDFYNEAERDTSLDQEALLIVVIVAVANAVGSLIQGIITPDKGFGSGLVSALLALVIGIGGYYLWSYVTLLVGTKLFEGDADFGEMKRTLGYAHAPRLLSLLVFIPCVGPILALAGFVLSLVAAVIAIREAMDFDTGKAVVTAVIGWAIVLVASIIVTLVFGGGI